MVRADVLELSHAVVQLERLAPAEQAVLFHGGTDALPSLIINRVRHSASGLTALVPNMRKLGLDTVEDDLTAVFGKILEPSIRELRWTLGGQHGGYSGSGGPGRRDLTLEKDGATVAVIEAVCCRRPLTHEWMRGELRSHFLKLLGYDTCEVFVHLTYATGATPNEVLDHLTAVCRQELPEGFAEPRFGNVAEERFWASRVDAPTWFERPATICGFFCTRHASIGPDRGCSGGGGGQSAERSAAA